LPWGFLPQAGEPETEFIRVKILRGVIVEAKMKKYVLLILMAGIVAACTSGKTEFFPSQGDSADAAEVTVIRERRMFGMGFSMKVFFDKQVIARLKAGQYVTFFVNPGVHSIGIPNQSISTVLERARKHYFAITTDSSQFGFEIAQISEREAASLMAQAKSIH
jgi:hypothetical protein